MSYEKDRLDSFVTSASLSTALAPYVTSASLASALGSLGNYVTSDSISVAVATNALTVRGAANVSATVSAGAVTVAGRPVGSVLLGYDGGTSKAVLAFSGSWSDFCVLELRGLICGAGGTIPVNIFTDGGTTALLRTQFGTAIGTAFNWELESRIFGGDDAPRKLMYMRGTFDSTGGEINGGFTSTATAGFVNCVRVSLTGTASYAFAALYGWRKT